MTPQDQIKAIAELAGWIKKESPKECWFWYENNGKRFPLGATAPYALPPWLTSRDAIIPVIEKQSPEIKYDIYEWLSLESCWPFLSTPPQLCEALLRATEKWVE